MISVKEAQRRGDIYRIQQVLVRGDVLVHLEVNLVVTIEVEVIVVIIRVTCADRYRRSRWDSSIRWVR